MKHRKRIRIQDPKEDNKIMNKKLIGISILAYLLVACTPYRRIDMKNRSGGNVQINWKLKESDSLIQSPFFMYNSETVTFELQNAKPYNEVKMSFGQGSWKRDTLAYITSWLESLEIKSDSGTIMLKSPEEIYSFLLPRRKGIGKRKIEILVTK